MAEIQAALAYYYDHQEMIRNDWMGAENLIAEFQGRYPSQRPIGGNDCGECVACASWLGCGDEELDWP